MGTGRSKRSARDCRKWPAWYGKSPAEFASIRVAIGMAIIDRKGRLLYEEEIEPPTGTAGSPTSTGALAPLDQTLKLHSKPGSKRDHLPNFVGATLTNTVWNSSASSITALPFDLDGVPYSFSTAELERIQYIWQRVAEDYAAFDVDVTTEPPPADALTRSSSGDDTFGTTVLITQRTFYSCSCGGVATSACSTTRPMSTSRRWCSTTALAGATRSTWPRRFRTRPGTTWVCITTARRRPPTTRAPTAGRRSWARALPEHRAVEQGRVRRRATTRKKDDFAVMQSNGLPLRRTITATPRHGDPGQHDRQRRVDPLRPESSTRRQTSTSFLRGGRGHHDRPGQPRRARPTWTSASNRELRQSCWRPPRRLERHGGASPSTPPLERLPQRARHAVNCYRHVRQRGRVFDSRAGAGVPGTVRDAVRQHTSGSCRWPSISARAAQPMRTARSCRTSGTSETARPRRVTTSR